MAEPGGGMAGRIAWGAGAVAVAMVPAVMLGFVVAYQRHATNGWSGTAVAVLAGMAALFAIGVWALIRWRHVLGSPGAPKGPSERANHRLLAWSAALGGGIGLAMAMAAAWNSAPGEYPGMLSGDLPTWFAVAIALAWGIALPIISWRWHQVIDEHERDAYRDGAVAGYYLMAIGAPVWWFLWRGGLAPAVDAFALFVAVMTVSGAVWAWRKYT